MRAHYLQHVPFEGPGSIESWLRTAGYAITHTRLFESAELPDRDAFDLLVVMGGPMSVNDESSYSWLVQEKQFIHSSIEAGKSVEDPLGRIQIAIRRLVGFRCMALRPPTFRCFRFPRRWTYSIGTEKHLNCRLEPSVSHIAKAVRIRPFRSETQ